MTDAPSRETPSARLPAEPLRRIDWLSVAPWLTVLRAPGATLWAPLLLGAVGVLLFEPWPVDSATANPITTAQRQIAMWPVSLLWWLTHANPDGGLVAGFWPVVRLVNWLLLGLLITDHATRSLAESPRTGVVAALGRFVGRVPRLLGALALLGVAAAPFALGLWLYGLAFRSPALEGVASPFWGLAAAAAGLPLTVIAAVGLFASPLLVAAVVIDEADPFDAISRAFAYTLQKPLTLAWCVAVAWLAGVAGGAIVETLLDGALTAMGLLVTAPVEEQTLATSSAAAFMAAMRGFYPAYLFTAGATVYLTMRHRIDGSPVDQTENPTYVASGAA